MLAKGKSGLQLHGNTGHLAALHRVGRPRKDITIERLLVWAFKREQVYAAVTFDQRSCRVNVEGGHGVNGGGNVHPDALRAYDAVCALDNPARGLVIDNAQISARPDWCPAPRHRFEPLMWADSPKDARWSLKRGPMPRRMALAQLTDDACFGRGRPRNIFWCKIIARDEPDAITFQRDMYSLWRDGVKAARVSLRAVLEDHRIVGNLPPATPWKDNT